MTEPIKLSDLAVTRVGMDPIAKSIILDIEGSSDWFMQTRVAMIATLDAADTLIEIAQAALAYVDARQEYEVDQAVTCFRCGETLARLRAALTKVKP